MKPCTQCGKCCINYSDGGLSVEPEEFELWELFRPDIARFVHQGEIWFDPTTKQRLTLCPFLIEENKLYSCAIYQDRPEDCKYYPVTLAQMIKDECEMLEASDLAQPEAAQQRLDALMADSRPSLK